MYVKRKNGDKVPLNGVKEFYGDSDTDKGNNTDILNLVILGSSILVVILMIALFLYLTLSKKSEPPKQKFGFRFR